MTCKAVGDRVRCHAASPMLCCRIDSVTCALSMRQTMQHCQGCMCFEGRDRLTLEASTPVCRLGQTCRPCTAVAPFSTPASTMAFAPAKDSSEGWNISSTVPESFSSRSLSSLAAACGACVKFFSPDFHQPRPPQLAEEAAVLSQLLFTVLETPRSCQKAKQNIESRLLLFLSFLSQLQA